MERGDVNIQAFINDQRRQLLDIWERSVLDTHHFLLVDDFKEIKKLVEGINFEDFQVYCLTENNSILGFVGVANAKIEMLFLDPKYFGKGFGYQLLQFAVQELGATKLDVNEQNENALNFYQKFGFKVIDRSETDDQGRNYPILNMEFYK